MLDINLIRNNPEIVEKDLRKRGDSEKLKWLKEIQELDAKWRQLKFDLQKIQHLKNDMSKEIAKLKKEKKDASKVLKCMRDLPEKEQVYNSDIDIIRKKIDDYLMRMPNILHESVPAGKDDSENKLIRQWGKKPVFDFEPKSHVDLLSSLD
ncbi:MAG: serine--tRNA ligase, partial [Candidatus Woesearchaeota archaeon]|nr:serine--tRNA ligase [Candidatus Woesearchaeota archaeon]